MSEDDGNSIEVERRRPPHERLIRVHLLTEFIYCPRAGLAQFEDGRIDERDGRTPRADYLPEYNASEIKTLLASLTRQIWAVLGLLVGFALLTTILGWLVYWPFRASGVLGCLILLVVLWKLVKQAVILTLRWNEYCRAKPGAPPADLQEDLVTEWWSILKNNFDRSPGRDMVDTGLGIRGKPYFVLRRGNLRIPVFLYGGDAEKVRWQDRARIAAYCHLLTTCEHGDCPYGIILRSGTYVAVAVPNNERAKKALREGLSKAREIIRLSAEETSDPRKPEDTSRCERCPVGKPHRYDPRTPPYLRYGEPLRARLCEDREHRTYHSLCADRFEWTPPHEIAKRRGWAE